MIIKHSDNGKFPLVLLHGWGLNSGVWSSILAQLELDYDVYRIDLPGFGLNHQQDTADYRLTTMVELVAPCCPPGCILAGWSLGGLVATGIALKYPNQFKALCLIASTPCFMQKPGWPGISETVLQQFGQALTTDINGTISRFLTIQALGSDSARKDVQALKKAIQQYPSAQLQALVDGLMILEQTDLRAALKTLTLPVKGIYGQRDTLVAADAIELLATTLPDFKYRVLDKAAHAPFISNKEDFIAAMRQLLPPYNQRH